MMVALCVGRGDEKTLRLTAGMGVVGRAEQRDRGRVTPGGRPEPPRRPSRGQDKTPRWHTMTARPRARPAAFTRYPGEVDAFSDRAPEIRTEVQRISRRSASSGRPSRIGATAQPNASDYRRKRTRSRSGSSATCSAEPAIQGRSRPLRQRGIRVKTLDRLHAKVVDKPQRGHPRLRQCLAQRASRHRRGRPPGQHRSSIPVRRSEPVARNDQMVQEPVASRVRDRRRPTRSGPESCGNGAVTPPGAVSPLRSFKGSAIRLVRTNSSSFA